MPVTRRLVGLTTLMASLVLGYMSVGQGVALGASSLRCPLEYHDQATFHLDPDPGRFLLGHHGVTIDVTYSRAGDGRVQIDGWSADGSIHSWYVKGIDETWTFSGGSAGGSLPATGRRADRAGAMVLRNVGEHPAHDDRTTPRTGSVHDVHHRGARTASKSRTWTSAHDDPAGAHHHNNGSNDHHRAGRSGARAGTRTATGPDHDDDNGCRDDHDDPRPRYNHDNLQSTASRRRIANRCIGAGPVDRRRAKPNGVGNDDDDPPGAAGRTRRDCRPRRLRTVEGLIGR